MSSGKSGGSQKVDASPWKPQQPYLTEGYQGAQDLYNQGPSGYFPNATYVPFSPQTEAGLGRAETRSLGSGAEGGLNNYISQQFGNAGNAQNTLNESMRPMGLEGASRFAGNMSVGQSPGANPLSMSTLSNTANGSMLNANPYLDQMFGRASKAVGDQYNEITTPGINATFGAGGRTGSDLHADMFGRAQRELGNTLGGMASDIYGSNYATERGNQLNAATSLDTIGRGWSADDISRTGLRSQDDLARKGLAGSLYDSSQGRALDAAQLGMQGASNAASMVPTASALDWNNIDRQLGVGSAVEGQAGNILSDQMNRYDFNQNAGWDNLNKYMSAINGNVGSSQTTQTPSGSPLTGALGGGLTGYAAGSALSSMLPQAGGLLGWGGLGALGPWGAGIGALAGLLG